MPDHVSAFVGEALRSRGFAVELIPESERPTADLRATKEGENFLFEIKTKTDDPALLDELDAELEKGSPVTETHEVLPSNAVAKIIRNAVVQLDAGAADDPIRLLWFWGRGARGGYYCDLAEKTLLGPTLLVDLIETTFQIECFFFYESSFFRWRDSLDGAVLSDRKGLKLCINPLSPRASRLRASALATVFGPAVVDPARLEAAGEACLADCLLDRRVSYPVLEYVRQKLSRRMLINVDMTYMRVTAKLPLADADEA